ncbi:MAG: hypothetical protein MUP21_01200 [Dehalococcoidia bacterium]|nr:hypothetical protein [Dehalococcoidia bacterium]
MKPVSLIPAAQQAPADSYRHTYHYDVPVITDQSTTNVVKVIGAGTISAVIIIFAVTLAKGLFGKEAPKKEESGAPIK